MHLFVADRKRFTAALLALAMILGFGIWFMGSRTAALAIVVNGQEIGKVKNNQIYNGIINNLIKQEQKRIGTKVELATAVDLKRVITAREELLPPDELQKKLQGRINFSTQGVWVIVDGKRVLAVKDKAVARQLLEDMRKDGAAVGNGEVLEWACFDQKVAFKTAKVNSQRVVSLETAKKIMTTGSSQPVTYTVKEGDTLWGIARRYNTYVADLMKVNHLTNEKLKLEQSLIVPTSQPYLTVTARVKGVRTETIAYRTKVVTDRRLAARQVKVKQQGKEGSKQVVYSLVKKNGVVVNSQIIAENIIKKPVDKIVAKGPRAVYHDSYQVASRGIISSILGGGWVRPLVGSITCRYGGYRGHTGMDIDGTTGQAIRAAKAGKVVFAAYSRGYGKNVVIDHGNGLKTRYAHCSKIYVKPGDTVAAGEVIAAVGSTGRSTGSHLHFEVIKNGGFINPANILR